MVRVRATHPSWLIAGTAFTAVTVNRDFRTAVHKDRGDLRAGFGVLTALRAGTFSGCHLVFPAYRVAVDLRTRGVLLCNVHEWHGNSPLVAEIIEELKALADEALELTGKRGERTWYANLRCCIDRDHSYLDRSTTLADAAKELTEGEGE